MKPTPTHSLTLIALILTTITSLSHAVTRHPNIVLSLADDMGYGVGWHVRQGEIRRGEPSSAWACAYPLHT